MKLLSTFLLVLVGLLSQAQDKRICITVDDLPIVGYGVDQEKQRKIIEALVAVFKKEYVPAIGYVNEGKLYQNGKFDSASYRLLELWPANGFELGNHTYSHNSYHAVSYADYTNSIKKGEQITKPLLAEYGLKMQYFRHPYLHSGLSKEKTDSLNQFLEVNGYTAAPVTIDGEDYIFAQAYAQAYKNGDTELMQRIGKSYIEYFQQKLQYYERMTAALFDRNIAQILLTHANQLNADYMDDLIAILRVHRYTFISQEEALKDTAYDQPVTKFGNWGISWLEKWTMSRGLKGDIWKGNPEIPEYISN